MKFSWIRQPLAPAGKGAYLAGHMSSNNVTCVPSGVWGMTYYSVSLLCKQLTWHVCDSTPYRSHLAR